MLINVLPNFSVRQLPDHPIRSRQHIRRNNQADLLGGFQVDDQLEIVWLLDRYSTGLAPINLVDMMDGGLQRG